MPGGKLVAVELSIRDNLLHDVVVTGDFFLYPEEALPVLAFAIEGAPVSMSQSDLTARISNAIPGDVHLVGASPEALAIAVERGLHPTEPDDSA